MSFRSLTAVGLSLSLSVSSLTAQCQIGDDGFNVGCCVSPQINLPAFTSMSLSATYLCIRSCGAASRLSAIVSWTTPVAINCDHFSTNLTSTVTVSAGNTLTVSGGLIMKYSRTWLEPDPTGAFTRQVWRFLVNGDLGFTPSSTLVTQPCPVPQAALAPFSRRIPMDGHIDYACEGGAGFRAVLSLNHLQGCVSWGGLAANPVAGLAGVSFTYHLVGPNPFVPANIAEPQSNNIMMEAVRPSKIGFNPTFGYSCISEQQVRTATLATVATDCVCVPSAVPANFPWDHQRLFGFACCNGVTTPFNSTPFPAGTIPSPTGLAVMSLGRFNGAAGTFPGQRTLFTYLGQIDYTDACAPAITRHLVVGVATGNQPMRPFLSSSVCQQPIGALPTTAIDLGNKVNRALSGAALTPVQRFAGVSFCSQLWNFDI